MKISEYVDLKLDKRTEMWAHGANITDISRQQGVKDKTVIHTIGNSIVRIYEAFRVGNVSGDIRISILEMDKMLKSYSHFDDCIYRASNWGFFVEFGDKIREILHADLHETGRSFYGSKIIYSSHRFEKTEVLLNNFLLTLKPNEELVTIHNEIENLNRKDDIQEVYAIIRSKELTAK